MRSIGFLEEVSLGACLGGIGLGQGAPVSLVLDPFPGITSGFANITCSATTNASAASGYAITFGDDDIAAAGNITSRPFNIR